MEEKQNIIVGRSLHFSIELVKYCEFLEQERKFVIARQLLRCGTSIGANVFEAQHCESRADFIHKMKIAIKEANETLYWLLICEKSAGYGAVDQLKDEVEQLIKIMSKIIISSKRV